MTEEDDKAPARGGGAARTRQALIDGAISALREVGFAGASARVIAARAECNPALIFYHFGSVNELLLAALDRVSAERQELYREPADGEDTAAGRVRTARALFEEDLERGYAAVLVEMIAGGQRTAGLGPEVAARIAPWQAQTADAVHAMLAGVPFRSMVPAPDLAHALVAMYLGMEMLAGLEGDHTAARRLFDQAESLAYWLDVFRGSDEPDRGPDRTDEG